MGKFTRTEGLYIPKFRKDTSGAAERNSYKFALNLF